MQKLTNIFLAVSFILGLMVGSAEGASPSSAPEVAAVIRQDCSGYPGPEPCYTSLAAWETDFGGVDFGAASVGDLVAADLIAVARIEGTWTQPDTTTVRVKPTDNYTTYRQRSSLLPADWLPGGMK